MSWLSNLVDRWVEKSLGFKSLEQENIENYEKEVKEVLPSIDNFNQASTRVGWFQPLIGSDAIEAVFKNCKRWVMRGEKFHQDIQLSSYSAYWGGDFIAWWQYENV